MQKRFRRRITRASIQRTSLPNRRKSRRMWPQIMMKTMKMRITMILMPLRRKILMELRQLIWVSIAQIRTKQVLTLIQSNQPVEASRHKRMCSSQTEMVIKDNRNLSHCKKQKTLTLLITRLVLSNKVVKVSMINKRIMTLSLTNTKIKFQIPRNHPVDR